MQNKNQMEPPLKINQQAPTSGNKERNKPIQSKSAANNQRFPTVDMIQNLTGFSNQINETEGESMEKCINDPKTFSRIASKMIKYMTHSEHTWSVSSNSI